MQWGRCLWASISIVSRGLSSVCWGSGMFLGIGGGGLFRFFLGVADEAVIFEFVMLVCLA